MKILIDLSYIKDNTLYSGVAKYAYRFLDYLIDSHLQEDFVLSCNIRGADAIRRQYPMFKSVVVGHKMLSKVPFIRNIDVLYSFRSYVNQERFDVVFCPYGSETNCLSIKSPKITVIHDIQLQIDLSGVGKFIHKTIDDIVIRNTDVIFTISNFSRKQILKYYPSVENKIINMGNSVSELEYVEKTGFDLPSKYVLYVGRLSIMKNSLTLLKAYEKSEYVKKKYKLVLVSGNSTWDYWNEVMFPYIIQHHLEKDVILKKNVSEQYLISAYKNASLFVFPSLREGFGSPPIEAAFMEIPVISSLADSLEEVTKGLLYYYKNPMDYEELSMTMERVLKNPPSKEQLHDIKKKFINEYSYKIIGERLYNYIENYIKNENFHTRTI